MSKALAYSSTGAKKDAAVTLPKEVFGLDANHDLLSLSYRASLAEMREAGPKVLTRGEVRGGGRKPWRQKGTGRARVGSRRSPIWRSGGIIFGPTGNENHLINLNTKTKRLATAQALSAKAAADSVHVLETFNCPEGKVKPTVALLKKMNLSGKVLIVVSQKDDLVERATRNIANVETVSATYLNVRNVLDADNIVISKKALDMIVAWLSGKPAKAEPASEKPKAETKKDEAK